MVKAITTVYMLFIISVSYGQSDDYPRVDKILSNSANYMNDLIEKDTASIFSSVVLVSQLNKHSANIIYFDKNEIRKNLYMIPLEFQNIELDIKLNSIFFDGISEKDKKVKNYMNLLFKITKAKILIFARKKKWIVFRNSPFKAIFSAPPPSEDITVQSLANWLENNIGYQAIVLKRIDSFIVVGSSTPLLERKFSKGIVLHNSAKRYVVDPQKMEGSALISLIKSDGPFAIFRIVDSAKNQDIKEGDKVLLESYFD